MEGGREGIGLAGETVILFKAKERKVDSFDSQELLSIVRAKKHQWTKHLLASLYLNGDGRRIGIDTVPKGIGFYLMKLKIWSLICKKGKTLGYFCN